MSKFVLPGNVLEKIMNASFENVQANICAHTNEVGVECCDSPIEAILIIALQAETEYGFGAFKYVKFVCKPPVDFYDDDIYNLDHIAENGFRTLFVQHQAQLKGWRVDFLINVASQFSGNIYPLIVECDGHEFHERTKEQAAKDRARDREFQAKGFTVFRFTGAEIYRDPCKCAVQITEWAEEKLYADKPKRAAAG
jgi:very-short-patch-repair endonuclease